MNLSCTQRVIPAKAGIHKLPAFEVMDSRLRGNDKKGDLF